MKSKTEFAAGGNLAGVVDYPPRLRPENIDVGGVVCVTG